MPRPERSAVLWRGRCFCHTQRPIALRGRSAPQGDSSVVQSCPLLPCGHRSDAERTLLSIYA